MIVVTSEADHTSIRAPDIIEAIDFAVGWALQHGGAIHLGCAAMDEWRAQFAMTDQAPRVGLPRPLTVGAYAGIIYRLDRSVPDGEAWVVVDSPQPQRRAEPDGEDRQPDRSAG